MPTLQPNNLIPLQSGPKQPVSLPSQQGAPAAGPAVQNLDQDAVRLAQAIRQKESSGNPNPPPGSSGEHGVYQWMPGTWDATTKKYNLDPTDFSLENQNKTAYMTIKDLKDQGVPPDKIAAYWNMGGTALTKGYANNVSDPGAKIPYDTPAYVKDVQAIYEHLKQVQGGQVLGTSASNDQSDTSQMSPLQKAGQVAEGFTKGAIGDVVQASQLGGQFANQTAGRVVNAIQGNGFTPLQGAQRESGISNPDSPQSQAAANLTKSDNIYQSAGKVGEFGASMLIPGKGVTAVQDARRVAGAMDEALAVVSPKETAKVIQQAYKQGRVAVSGLMRHVGMSPDQETVRAAQGIKDLVESGVVRAKNTAAQNSQAVFKAIGSTATDLVSKLRAMPVQPILHPEELAGVFKDAMAEIEKNPYLEDSAKVAATKMFELFKSKLPLGRDIVAGDILEARKAFDGVIKSLKPTAFDPKIENATSMALRSIRQGVNDLISSKAPDVAVKDLLAKQSAMYDALDSISQKGAAEFGTQGVERFAARHPVSTGLAKSAAKYGLIGLGFEKLGHLAGD